ncbi:MAG: Coenzyme F420 hydrogenase/dehydrogenase, beta subunit C-terminal domain [Thermodesulfobacteriota bacterium]|nr:Coenzyme F420 hydrogenase/dehydrogenase, beta subunit C-terminal domain [Thermodesulfobacteriota bacterium]
MRKNGFLNLHKKVIKKGLCTGCGTCVGVCPAGAIQFDFDLEEPVLKGSCTTCGICYSVCPGEDIPLLQLEKEVFGEVRTRSNELLGVSRAFLKGFAKDPEVRHAGASGGLITALLIYLLEQGRIDGALVSMMDLQKPWRVKPILARTRAQFIAGAQSKYTICPNNMALKDAVGGDRLAAVGLPCHIHGIRKLQAYGKGSKGAEKIVLSLGILCGSNQSYRATEHVIQKFSDISLEEIKRFEYRGGKDSQNIQILTHDGKEITISNELRRSVSHLIMKERCRMCCDFSAELADISLGEIFDPGRNRKVPHWNGVIVRTEKGLQIIEDAVRAGAIEVSPLEEDIFYANRGFEQKKYSTVYNLGERRRHGWPVPKYHYEFTLQHKKKPVYPKLDFYS